ncbi:translocon-associated protein subunit alpha isoform X1 [Halyomorpha halys]|uniref:translocon-associated protein subunit alpha isoform X1 n=1 Tax=Halyomorpha halys TaxID=286706 RepID=UPI0006D4EEBB|nr:translocon-associated protein subunit alpha isoform X1 [Halyomorpha halys]
MKLIYLVFLIALPALISTVSRGGVARAQEDDVDDEMVDVEGEETAVVGEDAPEEEEAQDKPTGSPDADTTILFTKPAQVPGTIMELPGGVLVEFLVGFKNKGSQDFVLETLDASFRYPMDFNFYIQNFSTLAYERNVSPGQEATLFYSFMPAEAFAGRPFGLSVNLRYRDLNGNQFYEGVYNETVNIIELDEGLDGETFFLYVFLGALVVLMLVVGQQFLYSVGKKRGTSTSSASKKHIEMGTSSHNDVDYNWLPSEIYNEYVLDPKSSRVSKSPKASPRQRKAKRAVGDD